MNNTIEGLDNIDEMYNILKNKNIDSPLITTLYKIIYQKENKEILLEYLK